MAHLDDEERALVLSVLLEEILSWVRTLSGTQRLRALLVFDGVGFLPPPRQSAHQTSTRCAHEASARVRRGRRDLPRKIQWFRIVARCRTPDCGAFGACRRMQIERECWTAWPQRVAPRVAALDAEG
ncbi:MAG: hypothetical protein ABIQ16_22555 [Polyangiaceae bacterium]